MKKNLVYNHLADTEGRKDLRKAAEKIKQAYDIALSLGETTQDLEGKLNTPEFARVLVQHILKIKN